MTSPKNSLQQRDEAAWLDLRKRLLHIVHSARFALLLRRRPALLERCQPGVFVVESAAATLDFAAEAMHNGLFVAWIDGERIAGQADFLALAARTLKFPDYFGYNWDAFEECLRDLEWLPARGYVLVLDGYARFARSDPKNWTIALEILEEAVNTWSLTETPMYVLLQGPEDAAPGIPEFRCALQATAPGLADRRALAKQT